MARPEKRTADYFPHYVMHGKTMFILEQRYKEKGFTFMYKLLEDLTKSVDHFIDAAEPGTIEYLATRAYADEDTFIEMMNIIANQGTIDPDLWQCRIIWCFGLMENLKDLYKKRKTPMPEKPNIEDYIYRIDDSFRGKKPEQTEVIGSETLQKSDKLQDQNTFSESNSLGELKGFTGEEIQKAASFRGENPSTDGLSGRKGDDNTQIKLNKTKLNKKRVGDGPKEPKKLKSEYVEAYREIAHLYPDKLQEAEINEVITNDQSRHNGDRLVEWKRIVKAWIMKGFNKRNIGGMLDWYRNGIKTQGNTDNRPNTANSGQAWEQETANEA